MINNNTHNNVEWCDFDFLINKYYWDNQKLEESIKIRNKNLIDLSIILKKHNANFWLQGRTLLGIYKFDKLLKDHDDDLGMWLEDFDLLKDKIISDFNDIGFSKIRQTESIISFIRDDRYIDLCLFTNKLKKSGYGHKWFSKIYFQKFENIKWNNVDFPIPQKSDFLLKEMYDFSLLQNFKKVINRALKLSNYKRLYRFICVRVLEKSPHFLRPIFAFLFIYSDIKYKKISEVEFREMHIEPLDSFNWRWRKTHLDIVTNNCNNKLIDSIINYFKVEANLQSKLIEVKETDTTLPFNEPSNFDRRFWQSGNNFFIYCINYEFREGVHPYSKANEYIREVNKPLLFSANYYKNLRALSTSEIEALVLKSPVEITNGAFTGGKHRAFAMIGRLVSGKGYVPFWAIIKK